MTRMHDKYRGFLPLYEFSTIFSVKTPKTITGGDATCYWCRNTINFWIQCGSGHTNSLAKIEAILKMTKNRPRSAEAVQVGKPTGPRPQNPGTQRIRVLNKPPRLLS